MVPPRSGVAGHRSSRPVSSRKTSSRVRRSMLRSSAVTPSAAHQAVTVASSSGPTCALDDVVAGRGLLGRAAGGQRVEQLVEVEAGAGAEAQLPLGAGQLGGRALGDHPAAVDDHDVVGELLGLVHVVGGEHHRHPRGAQLADQVPAGVPGLRVHARGRLVEEHQLGTADHGGGEGEPLLLPAGEPAVRRAGVVGEAEPVEQRVRVERVGVEAGDQRAATRRSASRAARRPDCGMIPTRARSSGRDGGRPSTRTVPPSARRNPSQISIVVVLPAPLGPRIAVTAPRLRGEGQAVDRGQAAVPLDQVDDLDGRGAHATSLGTPGRAHRRAPRPVRRWISR